MPMRAMPAALSSDHTTCTFGDGVYVVFNHPLESLENHVTDAAGIHLTTYSSAGSECGEMYYVENVGDVLAVAYGSNGSQGARWETPVDDSMYHLECGAHTYSSDPDDTLACSVPFFQYARSSPYSFTLDDAEAITSPLFTCE
jgi:hypothetical protein